MNDRKYLILTLIAWSLAICLGCDNDDRNPLVITLIVPDEFSGFFEIVPDADSSPEVTADNHVEVVVTGATTKSGNAEVFSRWHKLEARYVSGKKVPADQIHELSANIERQYFLIGDTASKDFFYSLGLVKSINSLREQHESFLKEKDD